MNNSSMWLNLVDIDSRIVTVIYQHLIKSLVGR